MLYLLAAIGAITVAILLWRLLGSERIGVPSQSQQQPPVAPDDDPEFLRRISEQQQQKNGDDEVSG